MEATLLVATVCALLLMGMVCHSMVVIDEQRQYTRGNQGPSDGRLLAFETAFEPVQWAEASAVRSYPGVAETHRRLVMLVGVGKGEAYVVYVFRVRRGAQHDFALHGSADEDGEVSVSVPVAPYGAHLLPGVQVRYPEGESDLGDAEGRNTSYAFFQHVSRGEVGDGVRVRFDVSDSPAGVRTHLPGVSGAEVFVGDAPSIRRAEENDALLDRFRMPMFLLRRKGGAPLASRFVVGPLRLHGEVGFVRERDGVVEAMGLWGGVALKWQDVALTGEGVYEGEVVGTLRRETGDACDALVVKGALPEGDGLKGATAVVRFGDGSTRGCRVLGVRSACGALEVVLEADPGFAVEGEGAPHLFFPHRDCSGCGFGSRRCADGADRARRRSWRDGGGRFALSVLFQYRREEEMQFGLDHHLRP